MIKNKNVLYVASIFALIWGIIGVFFGYLAIYGGPEVAEINAGFIGVNRGTAFLEGIFILARRGLWMFIGIIGLNYWAYPSKATTPIIFGIITIIAEVIQTIYLAGTSASRDIITLFIVSVFLIIYMIGAFQLKKSERKPW